MTKSFTTAVSSKVLDENGAEITDNLKFDLDDVEYEIRRPKSAQIALILASSSDTAKDDTGAVATFINVFFSLLVGEGEVLLKRRLMDSDDEFEIEDITDILFWLIEEGGPPYEVVVRLVALAEQEWWAIDGTCATAGVDPLDLPLNRFLNLVYAYYATRVEDKDRFDQMLTAPIPGTPRRRAADPSTARAETETMMQVAAWTQAQQANRR